jgi:hypothetical protein
MEPMIFKYSGPVLSEKDLEMFESQMRCRLPSDYRNFMLTQNGGDPNLKHFRVGSECFDTWLEYFTQLDKNYGSPSPESYYCTIAYQHYAYRKFLPNDCIIIGCAVGQDVLLLYVRGPKYGQVAIKIIDDLGLPWDDEDWGKDRNKAVYDVAASFTAFLSMLRKTST